MLLGYGIIAVPTGIVTTEMAQAYKSRAGQTAPALTPERKGTIWMPVSVNSAGKNYKEDQLHWPSAM